MPQVSSNDSMVTQYLPSTSTGFRSIFVSVSGFTQRFPWTPENTTAARSSSRTVGLHSTKSSLNGENFTTSSTSLITTRAGGERNSSK